MKHILMAVSLLLSFSINCAAQTLDRNNTVKRNSKENVSENFKIMKPYEIENKLADTIGDGSYKAAMSDVRAQIDKINHATEKDSIAVEISEIEKKVENKKRITKTDSIRLISLLENRVEVILKENDSLKMKYRLLEIISKQKAVKDTLSILAATTKEMRLKSSSSIEALRLYSNGLDSSRSISSKAEFKDSISGSIAYLQLLDEELKNINAILNSHQRRLKMFPSKPSAVDTAFSAELNQLSLEFIEIRSELTRIVADLKKQDSTWNHYFVKYIKTRANKPVEVSALPFFSTIPGLKDVNGSVNVIGNNIPKTSSGNYLEFGLFTGILKGSDSSNTYNIFISEVSNYAFYFRSNTGFVQEKDSITKLAVNTAIFYANKPINKDTTLGIRNNFNSSFFQGKFGIEYVVYRNLFSAYCNANAISAVTNKALFDQRFTVNTDIITYADFGFRMLLNTSINVPEGLRLYFDLNFLVNTDELKKFNPGSTDILIPNFRVGLRANLGRI